MDKKETKELTSEEKVERAKELIEEKRIEKEREEKEVSYLLLISIIAINKNFSYLTSFLECFCLFCLHWSSLVRYLNGFLGNENMLQ